jgi:hypothetical protein
MGTQMTKRKPRPKKYHVRCKIDGCDDPGFTFILLETDLNRPAMSSVREIVHRWSFLGETICLLATKVVRGGL